MFVFARAALVCFEPRALNRGQTFEEVECKHFYCFLGPYIDRCGLLSRGPRPGPRARPQRMEAMRREQAARLAELEVPFRVPREHTRTNTRTNTRTQRHAHTRTCAPPSRRCRSTAPARTRTLSREHCVCSPTGSKPFPGPGRERTHYRASTVCARPGEHTHRLKAVPRPRRERARTHAHARVAPRAPGGRAPEFMRALAQTPAEFEGRRRRVVRPAAKIHPSLTPADPESAPPEFA